MPRAFDACVIDLMASGVDQDRARRSCMAAYWAEHGQFPEESDRAGVDPEGDITGFARFHSLELSAAVQDGCGVFATGPMEEDGEVNEATIAGQLDGKRLIRRVRMLAPGKLIDANGQEFDFTLADCEDYARNFDPADQPDVLLDHTKKAAAVYGKVRALRVEDGALFGLWEFLGTEAVEKVLDGRWSRTSGRFAYGPNPEDKVVIEGSVVWRGAYDRGPGDRAQILHERGMQMNKPPVINPAQAAAPVSAPTEAVAGAVTEAVAPVAPPAPVTPPAAPVAVAAAATALPTDEGSLAIINQLRADVALLQAKNEENARHAELSACAAEVKELICSGKALPEMDAEELAILSAMPASLRPKYLELRKKLPNVWPAGPRQSQVHAAAPGSAKSVEAEMAEYQDLGKSLGYFKAEKAAEGGK